MRFRPTTFLSVVLLLGGFVWTTAAIAAVETRQAHPVYTNSRTQIGNGLPIPITGQAAPWGRIKPPTASPTLMQATTPFTAATSLPSGRPITIAPTLLTAPGNVVNLPVHLANPNVFQVETSITIAFPSASAQFVGSGRTGPSTATFCAGQSLGSPSAPVCTGPGDPNSTIAGLMRYTRTANQFGGPAQGILGGGANVALRVAAAGPCTYGGNPGCQVIFALASPATTAAIGGPFGFVNGTAGAAPSPGRFGINVLANGLITSITPTGLGAGLANPATSYGGPWTTGMLTVQNTAALGGPETFIRTGSDGRVAGSGGVSLVAGAVSDRGVSGPNANRGWLQLYVPEPGATLGAIGALLTLATCHGLARRRQS